jgi:hypothetical protein
MTMAAAFRWRGRLLTLFCLAALPAAAVLGGCGGTDDGESTEADKVSGLVSELADGARAAESFQELFADGAAPPETDRPRYGKYMYRATNVDISGETAEMTVDVQDSSNNEIGQVQWTAARSGDQWKLKSAPLP